LTYITVVNSEDEDDFDGGVKVLNHRTNEAERNDLILFFYSNCFILIH